MDRANKTGLLANISEKWLESLYKTWLNDPVALPREWQLFFCGFELGEHAGLGAEVSSAQTSCLKLSAVQSLIYRYRSLGHLLACTDPLAPCLLDHPLLAVSAFDLDDSDLDTVFVTRRFHNTSATLREIIAVMRETYCRGIGVEFMHIQEPERRQWLIDRMEPCRNQPVFPVAEKLLILRKLHEATRFEAFLHRRFVGQKRFSLEGGEVLIPVLDAVVRGCPAAGISDVVLGMPHRGRLNVLANIMGKPFENIFAEFRDSDAFGFVGDGDVKYHKGHSADVSVPDGGVHLTMAANPSHLEAVNPVVEGKCRARQDRYGAAGARRVLPLLIHGDAAFAGQGSVMEVLNMSRLEGYATGGTLHVVLNNQIGFTTMPREARSTQYATDVAKMLSCPIFHVQGEQPEAAVHAVRLALEYRQEFGCDVVLELICYRRHGHNEGDEPAFTQPLMYRSIVDRPPVDRIYADVLADEGVSSVELELSERQVADRLEAALELAPQVAEVGYKQQWSSVQNGYSREQVASGVDAERLLLLARRLAELPPGFVPHPKVGALLQKRFEAVLKGAGLDWGGAETLAYASLLDDGVSVRISGQDSQRGTFNHRHCVLHDFSSGETCMPLGRIGDETATFQVWNSLLSEFGVLGFEYGYSLESPKALIIWEAQFGDFANGAQVIIDQFISSGETKWNRGSGLVLLLPHGYEGQGAEHSSARIERYLQLCANDNMMVVCPSTPAQMFHLLRRQLMHSFRKPLIVFTPKSLLRHPRCVSCLDELVSGTFAEILADRSELSRAGRVLLCSGKMYYELQEEREKRQAEDVAIIRIEQFYPLHDEVLRELLDELPAGADCVWVQEEPENMGAWSFLRPKLERCLTKIRLVARPEDCCPAVASHHLHASQQAEVIRRAFE